MRPGISLRRALAILVLGLTRGRCPACGGASMFRGLYELHEACPSCGVRLEASDGAWLGAVAIGYAFGALFAFAVGLVELRWHPIAEAGLDPLWTIALVSLPVTALAYRPAKGLWFSLIYIYGLAGEE
jgi:uncharacterized protein (DUF983 family)